MKTAKVASRDRSLAHRPMRSKRRPRASAEGYAVVAQPEADGGFSIWVPDLPGCASQGDTYAEAITNVKEAISCHLEGLRADGLVPPPHRTQVAFVEATGS